jgi:hypothetical protein
LLYIQYIHSKNDYVNIYFQPLGTYSESNPESNALVLRGLDIVAFTTMSMKEMKWLQEHLLMVTLIITTRHTISNNPKSNRIVRRGLDVVAFTKLSLKKKWNDSDKIYFH